MEKMKKIIILVFLPIHILSFYLVFQNRNSPNKKIVHQSQKETKSSLVTGIDVSHHQGDIEWKKVKESGVDFCFIKATEGSTFLDKKFKKNVVECKKNGILIGSYHFYKAKSNPNKQFENFSKNVKITDLNFPPVIDLEYHTNECLKNPKNKNEFIKDLKIFEKLVRDYYGVSPIFYTNPKFYDNLLKDDFNNELWICDLKGNSDLITDTTKWLFWQHNFNGKINGINGDVDMNMFNGSLDSLNKIVINKK